MRLIVPLGPNTAGTFGRAMAAHLNQLLPSPRRWPKVSPKRFLAAATGTSAASPKVSASALLIDPGISAAVSIMKFAEDLSFLCFLCVGDSRPFLIFEAHLVTAVPYLHLLYFFVEICGCLVRETLAELSFLALRFQL
jgi:hypothetical protein